MRDAMVWVHDRVVDGMEAGTDVTTLMREIVLPDRFDLGEGYGRTSWNVRAIWEKYAGWFHHRSTTELYAVPASAVAGRRRRRGRRRRAASPRPVPTSMPGGRSRRSTSPTSCSPPSPDPQRRGAVAADATRALLDASGNFWETAWLRRSIDRLERKP